MFGSTVKLPTHCHGWSYRANSKDLNGIHMWLHMWMQGLLPLLTEALPHSQGESRKATVAWTCTWTWLRCAVLGILLLKLRTGWWQSPFPGTVLAGFSYGLKLCFMRSECIMLAVVSHETGHTGPRKWWIHIFIILLLWDLLMSIAKLAEKLLRFWWTN